MNTMFMVVIHYDGEIVKTDISVVFLLGKHYKDEVSKNISLGELKNEIERKIRARIVRLRYQWKTCDDPIRYSTIPLKDDDNVELMIVEHDVMRIRTVELHAKLRGRYDDSGPSISVFGSSSQMGFDTAVDDQPYRFGDSFVAMLESGTSDAFHPPYVEPSTFQMVEPTVDPSVDIDLENLQGWGELLADSSEDEGTVDPDLSGDDLDGFRTGKRIDTFIHLVYLLDSLILIPNPCCVFKLGSIRQKRGFQSTEMSVHQISRGKQKACKERVGELVSMIHGTDESYLKVNWNKRTELPIISGHDVRKAESALQELQSILKQSNNTVLNQDGGNEIHNSNPSHFTQIEDIQNPHEWMLMTKEESHSINEELNQIMAILEKKGQLMKNVNVCLIIAKMLQKVVCSCSTIAHCILDQNIGNQVQGCHGDGSVTYDRNKGQLRLIFPPTPVLDQEVISEGKQSKEVILTIRSVAGRLAELNLANPVVLDLEDFDFPVDILGDTRDIQNYKLDHLLPEDFDFPVDILDDTCNIQNYEVSKCNADALREIFDKHPNVDENFRISHPDFKNSFMNSLAGLYKKIKSGEEDMLELEDITNMESMVRDMELTAQKAKQEAEEAEQQLAELKKKRRFD
ncbi:hypothetical protein GQ457_11G022510 [Hibiscus cannabinus]